MDLAYWGFSHWPFQRRQTGRDMAIGTAHDEAYARLLFVIDERRRCASLTGAAGTGKTCLLRQAAEYARRQGRKCIAIDAAGMEPEELTAQIASQMQIDCDSSTAAAIWSRIQQQLVNGALVRQATVILVDNLDLADRACGAVLRRLMNLAESSDADATAILFSRDEIASSDLQQQIELTIELSGWSTSETAQFVSTTLRAAGTKREIFTSDAIDLIQELTLGVPANVVRICDLALLAAMSDDRHEVNAALVHAAVAEFSPRHSAKTQSRPFLKAERAGSMV